MTREKVNLVREHAPSYGLNQTLAALRIVPEMIAQGCLVGETVVRRVLGMWDLALRRRTRKPKASLPREHLRRKVLRVNLVTEIPSFPKQILMHARVKNPAYTRRSRS